ncbi:MAG: DNA repair protein RecN [Thermoanaerobaculales bacterium]|jgi:DNA repair protein RecN (Recombination protein N)|nr:DNA repair protein RecN [Thermoanaerobaculales bacterium]
MLEGLTVRGLGIIDAVDIELVPGFVALTGETGAGKSLLVSSLELLAGRRASAELVRTGDERFRVEARFGVDSDSELRDILESVGAGDTDRLVIRRELTAAGRGRCWVNDVTVTVATLQRMAPFLLSIHGQHEQYGLGDSEVQRRLVDDAGDLDALLDATGQRYREWRNAADELAELRAARASRRDRLDAIAFQLAEIDGVGPTVDEVERLRSRRLVLQNAARLGELTAAVLGSLDEGDDAVVDRLARAERDVGEMIAAGLPLDESGAGLAEARIHVEELVREVRRVGADVDGDPGELDEVEGRLHTLDRLMLKYGEPLSAVLEHREALLTEKARLDEVEDRLEGAAAAAADALMSYSAAAERLQRARSDAGDRLARDVEEILARLNMEGTRLQFRWRGRPDPESPLERGGVSVAFGADGVEEVELLIAANPGEEPRPMARIASGGELSRIHLALRTALRARRRSGSMTLLFDEVDSGLGGATAAALGGLLAELAATDQVLAVTHLPQVAAAAESHFRIDKVTEDGRAVTRVRALEGDERELELARMLAGDELGESARVHARALLGDA